MIPVYEFDEHNDAFFSWHRAIYEGFIHQPLDLIHIDAHNDMEKPKAFTKSLYIPVSTEDKYLNYYLDFAEKELTISNFILPAVLSRIVNNVYFIYPSWRKYRSIRKKMNISSVFGEGKIMKYNAQIDGDADKIKVSKALPDLVSFNYYALGAERLPRNRKVLLDIDLDFFACRDSILNHMSYELEITEDQYIKRDVLLARRDILFSGLDFEFQKRNEGYYAVIAHKKGEEVAYLPSEEEIEHEMNILFSILKEKNIIPVVVTICRSCISGYCPEDYHKWIGDILKGKLSALFRGLHYQEARALPC